MFYLSSDFIKNFFRSDSNSIYFMTGFFALFIFVLVVGIIIYSIYRYNNSNDTIHNNRDNGYQHNNVQPVNRVNNNNNSDTGMMVYFANDPNNLSDNEYRFSYKKVEEGYIVQFNFDLSTEGYLRFYCYEFSIETVGKPLQQGGNDSLIEDF